MTGRAGSPSGVRSIAGHMWPEVVFAWGVGGPGTVSIGRKTVGQNLFGQTCLDKRSFGQSTFGQNTFGQSGC